MSEIDVQEASNRSMDRLMATAKYGSQPPRGGAEQFVISVPGRRGKRVSVAFTLADTAAIIDELEAGAPCGICHANPCKWRDPKERLP
jgi:hypothetical protein